MARSFPFLAITMMAAMALVATAYPYKPSGFVPVPYVEKDGHVQYLGEFAVRRYNEQKHAYLKFIQVTEAQVLDRGTEHYTYKLVIKVQNGYAITFYKSEILQDLSAPGKPPSSTSPTSHHCDFMHGYPQ